MDFRKEDPFKVLTEKGDAQYEMAIDYLNNQRAIYARVVSPTIQKMEKGV